MKPAYYNEFDPYAAQWLRNLIAEGLIPEGEVDERPIQSVAGSDLGQFRQCHFFAGIGGWPLAARLAGWPDDRELWTGSAPCQPFSVAGKGKAQSDDRHLWPYFFRLIRERRPAVVMGEQVAAAVGKHWLDGVFADLEGEGYACEAAIVPACAVNAPHRRDRVWFVGDAKRGRLEGLAGNDGAARGRQEPDRPVAEAGCSDAVAYTESIGVRESDDADSALAVGRSARAVHEQRSHWDAACWIVGHDGKARRVEPGIRLLAHGVPNRIGRLRAYGNAIVPQVAAEVIGAYLDTLEKAA